MDANRDVFVSVSGLAVRRDHPSREVYVDVCLLFQSVGLALADFQQGSRDDRQGLDEHFLRCQELPDRAAVR